MHGPGRWGIRPEPFRFRAMPGRFSTTSCRPCLAHCARPTVHCPLCFCAAHCALLTARGPRRVALCELLTAHRPLCKIQCALVTEQRSLRTARCAPLAGQKCSRRNAQLAWRNACAAQGPSRSAHPALLTLHSIAHPALPALQCSSCIAQPALRTLHCAICIGFLGPSLRTAHRALLIADCSPRK